MSMLYVDRFPVQYLSACLSTETKKKWKCCVSISCLLLLLLVLFYWRTQKKKRTFNVKFFILFFFYFKNAYLRDNHITKLLIHKRLAPPLNTEQKKTLYFLLSLLFVSISQFASYCFIFNSKTFSYNIFLVLSSLFFLCMSVSSCTR